MWLRPNKCYLHTPAFFTTATEFQHNMWGPCGGFLKWWYPQNTPNWSFLVGKPMVVGYHQFRKPPCDQDQMCEYLFFSLPWVHRFTRWIWRVFLVPEVARCEADEQSVLLGISRRIANILGVPGIFPWFCCSQTQSDIYCSNTLRCQGETLSRNCWSSIRHNVWM